jgi:hypothetical protein
MLNTKRIKKQTLDNEELIIEFFEDVSLIALVSPLSSYKLVWHIQQAFQYNFFRDHENEITFKKQFYKVYRYCDQPRLMEHFLITNRQFGNYLLPEAKNVDCIWMIKGGHFMNESQQQIMDVLNQIDCVDHHFKLLPNKLHSRQNLIL